MRDIDELVDGYHRFIEQRYPSEAAVYQNLAEKGQSPRTMVIGCCDSRVDPSAIFNAGPGQLFVLRNVANLVPPYEPHSDYAGTSAALEFAVTGLNVENIVVMGHGRCGGIRAFLDGRYERPTKQSFIDRWMSLLRPAHSAALRDLGTAPIEVRQIALEHGAIRFSIENLKTFPFIQERVDAGNLRLRGAYFDIADGKLLSMDPETGQFSPLD